MSGGSIRTDLFPLVLTSLVGEPTRADVEVLFRGFERLYEGDRRFVVLSDLRGITAVPGAAERQWIAQWTERNKPNTRRLHLGSALLVKGALVRGALTAIQWLTRPTTPEVPFTDPQDAARWCTARLDEAELELPPRARSYLMSLT